MGVSGVIIEDKTGLKKNSLLGPSSANGSIVSKSLAGRSALEKRRGVINEFMIIGRIESLILHGGIDDALLRAHAYVGAGADGVMIHGRKPDPSRFLNFATDSEHLIPFLSSLLCLPRTTVSMKRSCLNAASMS
jgi:2-methylisocitrate lyase-like PEP mutase family enzyme